MSVSDTLQSNDENFAISIPPGDDHSDSPPASGTRPAWDASASSHALAEGVTGLVATLDAAPQAWTVGVPHARELPIPRWLLDGAARSAAAEPRYERLKRGLDLVVASTALVLSAPLWLLCAVAIKVDSPGPVIFAQHRYGRAGRRFLVYKFRTMVADAEARRSEFAQLNERQWPDFKIRRDPRITRVGAVLRRFSIDELPQLWNVVSGDMSLVGPRPTHITVEHFPGWRRKRFDVLPGLTCIWQIYGRDEKRFDQRCILDNQYVEHRSMRLDLYLLLRTIPVLLLRPSGS